jgi:hypothetical protein
MHKQHTRPTARVLSVIFVLALLALSTSLASAQPRTVTTSVTELAKLTASDGATGDEFGYSVSMSGDTVVVGAYTDEDNGDRCGSVYVFERDAGGSGNWEQAAKLTASDAAEDAFFGWSVSISGDTVVVGAHGADGKGAAYVFERDCGGVGNWGQTAKLSASDGAAGSGFGAAVSIVGDTVVVGAPGDDNSGSDFGSAYVFERDAGGAGTWGEVAKLAASDGIENDYLGRAVSVDGDVALVGAWGADHIGRAFLYERDAGGADRWGQVAKLTASDGGTWDLFGSSVSISSDTAVVGAYGDDDSGDMSGTAYLFEKPGSGWTNMNETAKLTATDSADSSNFGYSVSVSGAVVVVGSHGDGDNGTFSGSAYLFKKPAAGWDDMTETAKFTASDCAEQDYFAWSVATSGAHIVAGARQDDDNGEGSGSAYLFTHFTPAAWVYLPVVLRSAP